MFSVIFAAIIVIPFTLLAVIFAVIVRSELRTWKARKAQKAFDAEFVRRHDTAMGHYIQGGILQAQNPRVY